MPYQVGSFAVGNRLLPPEERTAQADSLRANASTSGHRACQGCGEALGARYVVDAALSRARANGLLASCDAIVSLHRGEGFGLVLAEAMSLAKPVIATGW